MSRCEDKQFCLLIGLYVSATLCFAAAAFISGGIVAALTVIGISLLMAAVVTMMSMVDGY